MLNTGDDSESVQKEKIQNVLWVCQVRYGTVPVRSSPLHQAFAPVRMTMMMLPSTSTIHVRINARAGSSCSRGEDHFSHRIQRGYSEGLPKLEKRMRTAISKGFKRTIGGVVEQTK